jgi:hypothetical protein
MLVLDLRAVIYVYHDACQASWCMDLCGLSNDWGKQQQGAKFWSLTCGRTT